MVRLGPWLVILGIVLGGTLAVGLYAADAHHSTQTGPADSAGMPAPIALLAEPGDAGRGRVLYERNCSSCHGLSGKGDVPLHGPLLNAYYRDDRVLAGLIRNGVATMPGTPASQLNDQQVADLIAYLRALP